MSTLTISEYVGLAVRQSAAAGAPQVPQEQPIAEQTVAVTGTSTQCSAFNAKTSIVRLNADGLGAIAITFGLAPVATVPSGGGGSGRLSANATEFRGVQRGINMKLAAIVTT